MKTFVVIFSFIAVVSIELSNGTPLKHRIRRETEKSTKVIENSKSADLLKNSLNEIVTVQKHNLILYKQLFEKIVQDAKKVEMQSDAFKEYIEEFQEIIDEAEALNGNEFEDAESIEKLFDISTKFIDFLDKFELSKEQKTFARLLDENDVDGLNLNYFAEFVKFRNQLETRVGKYIEGLTKDEKQKETKLIEWLQKLKNAKSVENYVSATFEFFELFEESEKSLKAKE